MNVHHEKYPLYLSISNNWPLDDWSITKECFDKIVEILPFGKTILEIGSGNSTNILSNFYNIISIESNEEWMNKYNSEYHLIPFKKFTSSYFGETNWLDPDLLFSCIKNKNYDMLIVDAGADRVGIIDYINLFNQNIPIIFDDTMDENYLKCAKLTALILGKTCSTFNCSPNKYAVTWFNGKKFSLIY